MSLDSERRQIIAKRETKWAAQDQGTEKKTKARLFWPILSGIALIVAMLAFIPHLLVLLHGGKSGIALPVFAVASFVLIAMTRLRETPPAMVGDRTVMAVWHRLPWTFVAYCVITGMGYNWVCAVLWFSRRYAVFSGPVVGAIGVILTLYAVMGIAVAWLTGGNWRTALAVFVLAPCILSGFVLRLRLLGT